MVALLVLIASLAKADDYSAAYKKSLETVVYIGATDLDWKSSCGSGVLIGDGFIITAYHVVGSDRLISVHMPEYDEKGELITDHENYDCMCEESEAVVVARDPRRDLAIIRLKRVPEGLKKITFGKSASPGQAVFTVGNSPTSMWHFASGNARQIHQVEETRNDGLKVNARITEVTVPLNPGDSGGPLTNLSGELIGVNSAVQSNLNPIGKCVDISEVKAFIEEYNESTRKKK